MQPCQSTTQGANVPPRARRDARNRFLDRYIDGELSPEEELFVLCNAYHHSKGLRLYAALCESEARHRPAVWRAFRIARGNATSCHSRYKNMHRRKVPYFGTRLREFIYNQIPKADHFSLKAMVRQN